MTDGTDGVWQSESLRPWVILGLSIVVAIALGVAMILLGFAHTDDDRTLYLEIAKSGLQLVVVGVAGTAFSAGWRWIESRRETRRVHDEARRELQLTLFLRLVASYNEVKAIRRTLRSYGLRDATGAL